VTTIRKLISAWMLALVGSLLLPLMSVAAVSGTTYDAPPTITTASLNIAQRTVAVDTFEHGESGIWSMASGQARSLFGLSQILVAPGRGASVWSTDPLVRGRVIEGAVTKQYEAQGWFALDDLTRAKNWPLVDFQKGNTLVSLKSVDTTGSTWLTRMQEHIRDLGTRGATVGDNPANMVLDLRVQPGGTGAASSLVPLGERYGVTVNISEFP